MLPIVEKIIKNMKPQMLTNKINKILSDQIYTQDTLKLRVAKIFLKHTVYTIK